VSLTIETVLFVLFIFRFGIFLSLFENIASKIDTVFGNAKLYRKKKHFFCQGLIAGVARTSSFPARQRFAHIKFREELPIDNPVPKRSAVLCKAVSCRRLS
jgi:hypothetical protein